MIHVLCSPLTAEKKYSEIENTSVLVENAPRLCARGHIPDCKIQTVAKDRGTIVYAIR